MPKRRDETKNISIGELQDSVINIVKSQGLIGINQIVDSLAKKYELDLNDDKAFDAFKKRVRLYLQKSAENGELFGRAYFKKSKDNPERVSIQDLEKDQNGKIKNKYTIKYFIKGSSTHIPGGDFLINCQGYFLPHSDSEGNFTVEWQISRFDEIKPNHFFLVFEDENHGIFSLSASLEDRPFSIVIGKGNQQSEYIPDPLDIEKVFKRPSVLLLGNRTITSPKKGKYGHGSLYLDKNLMLNILDFGSTNGTQYLQGSTNDIGRVLKLAKKWSPTRPKGYSLVPEGYNNLWKNLENSESNQTSISLNLSDPMFVRFGLFNVFIFSS